jgi:hypothetical protein
MKAFAFILILSMGLLGLNRFTMALDSVTPQTELSCSMDCCTNHDTWDCDDHSSEEKQEPEETPEKGPECSGGCDCSYSIQILAMECLVQSQTDLTPRVFNHASFQENYYFDYLIPHFQPPRKA